MSLTWRKRIHVTYELVTDLPVEPYSAQKMPKVKVRYYSTLADGNLSSGIWNMNVHEPWIVFRQADPKLKLEIYTN